MDKMHYYMREEINNSSHGYYMLFCDETGSDAGALSPGRDINSTSQLQLSFYLLLHQ